MSNCSINCNCQNGCTVLAVIASSVIGIITAFLTITAAITVTPVFLWVLFGIAVVYLAIALITSYTVRCSAIRSCVCTILPVLLTGILGTVLAAVILLAFSFVATSIIGAIITGALLFFFSLTLTTTACLTSCAAGCNED